MRTCAAIVLLALGAVCAANAPPPPTPLPQGARGDAAAAEAAPQGRIVFSSNRSGAWRLWMVGADGAAARQLLHTDDEANDVDPAVSPDGKRILFTSTRGGKIGVWVVAADGAKPERLTDGDQAEWSPDGKRIVLRRDGRIVTRHLAGGAEKTITPADWTTCSGPAWSPDSKTIAFARLQGSANALYAVPAEGGQARLVYDKKGACEPHWSPDSQILVYETETHLATIRPDGTKNRLVTYFGGVQRLARFSPDGKHLVFCQAASPEGPWELYVVPAAGGTPRRLTEEGSDMYPDWK